MSHFVILIAIHAIDYARLLSSLPVLNRICPVWLYMYYKSTFSALPFIKTGVDH
eukprot:m.540676 g.540676  ORF g.540676 m.540676 type:complete len:54 (-) comp22102_c0_seq22:2219-2380(-)